MISLDLETTSTNLDEGRVIEIGAIKFKNGKIIETFQTFINPECEIPEIITHITGITDQETKNAPKFSEIGSKLTKFIGKDKIIGHNIQFDIDFLTKEGLKLENKTYDTYQLANLLFDSPSFSLETLTKNLGIEHTVKHRAIDDAKACVTLFQLLTSEIEKIPIHTLEEIKLHISKTDWPLKDLFIKAKGSEKSTPVTPKIPLPKPLKQNINIGLTEKILSAFETEKNLIIEAGIGTKRKKSLLSAAAIQARKNHERIVISVNNMKDAKELRDLSDVPTQILESHDNYLSTKRLNSFKLKESFTNEEISLLIKILLGKSMDRLTREERVIFKDQIACDLKECDHDDSETKASCAFASVKENAIDSDIIIVDHSFLLSENEKSIPPYRYLMIEKADGLEKAGMHIQTLFPEVLEQKYPKNKVDMLFGLIGIFFEKYKDETSYQLTLNEYHYRVIDWQRICQAAENISKDLTEIFTEEYSENRVNWIAKNKNGGLYIKSALLDTKDRLATLIKQKKSTILLFPAISVDRSFAYIKTSLGLYENFDEITEHSTLSENEQPELLAPMNFPAPNQEGYFKNITSFLLEAKGKTFVLINSQTAIESMYQQIAPVLKEKGIKILARGLTGGYGKILDAYETEPENCVIFGNFDFWDSLEIEGIEKLIITKLPFDPPSEPVFETMAKRFTNSFEEYGIPRAYIRIKQAVYKLIKSNKNRPIVVLLDTRVHTKKYGKLFIKACQNQS